jgi:CRISPR-associated endonuclease Csn1
MRVLGLDGGIASIGWALIEVEDSGEAPEGCGKIIASGVWMFDPPEEKTQTGSKLKSEIRRNFKSQRRVLRRRRQRMNEIRRIFARHGLLPRDDRDALQQPGLDPWRLRTEALERVLAPVELAVALGHIARHRGFKSNARVAKSVAAAIASSATNKAIAVTQEKLARFQTPAQMLCADESFLVSGTPVRRLRNREGDHSRTQLRDDIEGEARALFRAQARLQAEHATTEFEAEFTKTAFFQRPLQDSELMVGRCPFEPDQRRSAKHGFSFERFRCLSRLRNLTLLEGSEERFLSANEINAAMLDFGASAKFTFAALREKLKLLESVVFVGVSDEKEKRLDVVARSGAAAAGTHKLRSIITDALGATAWSALQSSPERLDRLAEIISFRNKGDLIRRDLLENALDETLTNTLATAAKDGALDLFVGAGHISAKAARNIIPGLEQGLSYDRACAQAGYDHTVSREREAFDVGVFGNEALARILSQERVSRELVGSPTARKALIEALKQVKAIVETYGVPDFIHVELARDVGKSIDERREIARRIETRNKQKEALRQRFVDELGCAPRAGGAGVDELLRFELWCEQNGRCLYSDARIDASQLVASDNSVQIDHILPWSRFGDDSYSNKTLCLTQANRGKKERTPFEWFSADKTPQDWEAFVARVESLAITGLKKRNYKLKSAQEAAEKFRARNLNDTRWACRLLAEALKQLYPDDERNAKGEKIRRVFARPGALNDRLRKAFGLQWIKKNEKGERILDDRHHALDAIIVAATTESVLNRATRRIQKIESEGLPYELTGVSPPWADFREACLDAMEEVFVARAERKRARGKAHDATLRQIATRDGEQRVYERKSVADLKIADLERIKDPDRNIAIAQILRAWIEAGKPAATPPRSPKGDPIRKIRLAAKGKVNILIDTGNPNCPAAVDRGDMARVDVFRKANAKGILQYFLVPIYPHEIAMLDAPPMRAVQGGADEEQWPLMDSSFEFMWSMTHMTLLEIVKTNGAVVRSYFRSLDRNTGALTVSNVSNVRAPKMRIGARTLLGLKKLHVDRLGRVFEVEREQRTWRGKVCNGG